MKPDKSMKGIRVKNMLKCDACGEYHPVEDCEVVVIKLVKGKDCKLTPIKPFSGETNIKMPDYDFRDQHRADLSSPKEKVEPAPVDGIHLTEAEVKENLAKRSSLVPPAFSGVMIPPGHPSFERNGAKETRRV